MAKIMVEDAEHACPEVPMSHEAGLSKSFDACIHCGMCLSACPTYQLTGDEAQSPRGRIHITEAWQEGRLTFEEIAPALETCFGCMACETACPSKVPYHHVLEATRFEAEARGLGRFSLFAKVLHWVLMHDAVLAFGAWGLRLTQRLGIRTLMQALPLPLFIKHRLALWPEVPMEGLSPTLQAGFEPSSEVSLHLGCVMKHLMPDVHNACERVLTAMGATVSASPLGCCGALAGHHGLASETRAVLHQNAQDSAGIPLQHMVLSNAGGCGAMLQHAGDYSQKLSCPEAMQAPLQQLADQVKDIHAWALENIHRLPPLKAMAPLRVTYQASCHLYHAQGIQDAPITLLRQVAGLEFTPMVGATDCCGSAGVYNLEFPETADAIAQKKAAAILATGADVVVVGNPGCLIQLKAALAKYAPKAGIRVLHPMQLLAEAL
jgi:glycolate oxidase iron-sulfur subunit